MSHQTDPSHSADLASLRAQVQALQQENDALRQSNAARTSERDQARDATQTQAAFYEPRAEAAAAEIARLTRVEAVLKQIRGWDVLDIPNSDGPYWKRTIDAALTSAPEGTSK